MKPKVMHLIGDKLAGGSNLYVQRLISSKLSDHYDFSVFRLEGLCKHIRNTSPEVIVFHYPSTWRYLIPLIKLKLNSKIILVDHHYCQGFEQNQVPSLARFHMMLRLTYGLVDRVLCVSAGQKQWMLNQQLVDAQKLRVIPLSASGGTKIEDLLKISPKKTEKPLVLAAYGRFARQKGFDILLQAMALLPKEEFILYLGGYGFEEEQIKTLAHDLPQVKLVGTVKDVPEFLSQCDVAIIPSRWEPGGTVCLEAKAAGKPVVAPAIDAFPEHLENCGLLYSPNNSEQLAEAITSLPEKDLLAWGQIGRNSVTDSWEHFLNNWDMLLQEVIG